MTLQITRQHRKVTCTKFSRTDESTDTTLSHINMELKILTSHISVITSQGKTQTRAKASASVEMAARRVRKSESRAAIASIRESAPAHKLLCCFL